MTRRIVPPRRGPGRPRLPTTFADGLALALERRLVALSAIGRLPDELVARLEADGWRWVEVKP